MPGSSAFVRAVRGNGALPCGAVQQHTKGAAEQAIIGNVLPEPSYGHFLVW